MRLADLNGTNRGPARVAALTGEIDISNAQSIRKALTRGMSSHLDALILDLTDVEFFDSAGIHLIYQLVEDLRARGQALRLVIPSISRTNDALRLAGVISQVAITETVDEALRKL